MDASRLHHRLWLALIGCLSIMPLTALATTDDGVLTVGAAQQEPACRYGYIDGFGSYSPTGLTGGQTVTWIADIYGGLTCSTSVTDFQGERILVRSRKELAYLGYLWWRHEDRQRKHLQLFVWHCAMVLDFVTLWIRL